MVEMLPIKFGQGTVMGKLSCELPMTEHQTTKRFTCLFYIPPPKMGVEAMYFQICQRLGGILILTRNYATAINLEN
jgi:hypothetical protein